MLHVVLLITPVFVLIVAGYWARHSGFLDHGFWAPAEKLGYRILLPALIIDSLATNPLSVGAGKFAIAIAITIVGMSVPMLLVRRLAGWAAPSFASVHQGSIRLNGLLAIAVTLALLGPETLPLLAIMVAAWVPLSNGLSVYAYVAGHGNRSPLEILSAVVRNPMVFSVLLGVALNVAGLGPFIDQFFLFELLGRAALPVGLLTVGAALNLNALRRPGPRIGASLALKLVFMPCFMMAICAWLQTPPLVTAIAVLCAAMPSSPSGYLVAKQLGGDHELMATIITAQTVTSVITVSFWGTWAASSIQ
ncbi:MAG: AEC family transporter [Pseudomonadota bacterium]